MKLFVGNLPFSITEDALHDEFAAQGSVISTKIITDRDTGRSKGFGFVEMATAEQAQNAINQFHGYEFEGRALTVNEAKPMEPREKSRGFGGGGRRY